MVDFKADERLNTLNHSCAHVMAQAVKHLYPHAKFWVGPVVKEGFYYDIDLGDDVVNRARRFTDVKLQRQKHLKCSRMISTSWI